MGLELSALINGLPGAAAQGLIWGIMAIGVYITFKIQDIADLTVDGSLCTGGATCVMMLLTGHSMAFSLIAALIAGMLAGLATGLICTIMGIQPILAGILTQLGLYSINLKIMGKSNQPINANNFDLLVSLRNVRGVSVFENTIVITAIIVAVIIALLYWFFGTELGCSLRAAGNNEAMCRANGVNVNMNKVIGLTLSNGLVGFSGALLAQYQGFADINMGRGAIVIGLAAVVIGEALFGKIFKNFAARLVGVVIGSIIYYFVMQVVLWLKVDAQMLKLFSAIIVMVFLGIPYLKGRYFGGVKETAGSRAEKARREGRRS